MSRGLYIWILRWGDFQHYAPERDRAPAWIKAYTKQHDEDEYRALTGAQRAVLHDLRIAFARARGKLTKDTRGISQRIALRVTNATLEALNDAGYIEFVSRATLERRLEEFYASRARAPAHQKEEEREEEVEVEIEPRAVTSSVNGDAPPPLEPPDYIDLDAPPLNSPRTSLEQTIPELRSLT